VTNPTLATSLLPLQLHYVTTSSPLPPIPTPKTQLPYLLPLLDTLPYGRFLFLEYPYVARVLLPPLGPLNSLYHLFPFSGLLVFLAVYSGIVNNQNLSRFTRLAACQAVVLDILLM